jgi:hypothetical protein
MHRFTRGSQPAPALGADVNFVPETADSFRLLTVRARLVTSAVVANRIPHFQLKDKDGTIMHEIVAAAAQVASTTITYQLTCGNGAPYQGGAVSDGVSGLAWPDLWWPAGATFDTLTTAIDVGDAWSVTSYAMLVGDEFEHLRWLKWIADAQGG